MNGNEILFLYEVCLNSKPKVKLCVKGEYLLYSRTKHS